MRSMYLAVFALTSVLPARVAAQSGTTQAAVSEPSPDSAQAAPKKKKGGMFGKVKGLANNKIVKTVAKAALCTAVPGGQVIAGALDASKTKSVAGAANTALSGGASSCMPGMGMAGSGLAGAAAGGLGGAAVAGLGVAAMSGGVPGMPGGMPTGAMPGAGMSPEQMKLMMDQYSKMGMPPAQLQAMQQMMAAQMAQAAPAGQAAAGRSAPSEGAGKPIEVSSELLIDLKMGKTIVRNIDWVGGTASISSAGSEPFNKAMAQVAAAMAQAGGHYRLDLYFDPRYEDIGVKKLGTQRLSLIQTALAKGGLDKAHGGTPKAGSSKKDKDPRLEIVKIK